jgi:hypothetical protein
VEIDKKDHGSDGFLSLENVIFLDGRTHQSWSFCIASRKATQIHGRTRLSVWA